MLMRQPCSRREAWTNARHRDLGPDVSANVIALRAGMETGGAVDAVAVEQGHCRHLQGDRAFNQCFGLRCTFEKTECAGSVQLDITLSHRAPPSATDFA